MCPAMLGVISPARHLRQMAPPPAAGLGIESGNDTWGW
jgi:hypothetical protein